MPLVDLWPVLAIGVRTPAVELFVPGQDALEKLAHLAADGIYEHRATSVVARGDIAGGLALATRLLDRLPADQHNATLYAVARHVTAVVPAAERNRIEFAELRDRLAVGAA